MDVATIAKSSPSPLSLLGLPREIRDLIYEHLLLSKCRPISWDPENHINLATRPFTFLCRCALSAQILRTCRQIHAEARSVLYERNTFDLSFYNGTSLHKTSLSPAWETQPRVRAMKTFNLYVLVDFGFDDSPLDFLVRLAKVPEIRRLNVWYEKPSDSVTEHIDQQIMQHRLDDVPVSPILEPARFLTTALRLLRNVRSLAFNGVELVWDGFRATTTPLEYEGHLRRLDQEAEGSVPPDPLAAVRADFGSFSEAFGWEVRPSRKRYCVDGALGGEARVP